MDTQQIITKQMDDQLEFIHSLDLASTAFRANSAESQAAYVVGGSIISFVEGVDSQSTQDVVNSTLLAQLAADKKVDRYKQQMDWYNFYIDVISKLGWQRERPEFNPFHPEGNPFSLEDVLTEIGGSLLNSEGEAILKKTIQTIKSLEQGNQNVRLFETSSHSQQNSNFQIGIVNSPGGAVSMDMMAFSVSSTVNIPDLWGGSFSSADTTFNVAKLRLRLNQGLYASVRNSVISKLGSRTYDSVKDLGI